MKSLGNAVGMNASPVSRYLQPEIFPAQRDDLISAAIAAGAPDEVLELLGAVDSQEEFTYRRFAQVLAEH